MPLYLEGRSAAVVGRRMTVTPEKPFLIRTKTTNHVGQVQIAFVDGHYFLENKSHMRCRINGTEHQYAVLSHADELEIGKDQFIVDLQSEKNQANSPSENKNPNVEESNIYEPLSIDLNDEATDSESRATPAPTADSIGICLVCDSPLSAEQVKDAWSDGKQYICKNCKSEGAITDNLLDETATGPDLLPGDNQAPASSPDELNDTVNDELTVEEAMASDDATATPLDGSVPVGDTYRKVISENAETEIHKKEKNTADSDRYRQSRRISASRLAAIDPAPRKGLLSKVSKVFSRKDDREQRLEKLEAQRKALLIEAGRHALGPGGSMGLSDDVVKKLLAGGSVHIQAHDLSAGDLDSWRTQRQQMVLLDAEIAALRRGMGLGQDPRTHNEQAPPLRPDHKAMQDRAFASMDGMSTDELSHPTDESATELESNASNSATNADKSGHSTGRVRPIIRRRR